MGTATSTICAALVMLLGAGGRAQDTILEREGKHFRIVFHGADLPAELAARLVDESLATVETFWPMLDKLLPVRVSKPGSIHVYRSEKEWKTAEAKSPMRFRLEAFITKELEGHVWMRPELRPEFLQEIGLPQETVANLRFVAAEQVITPLVPATDENGWLRSVAVMGAVEIASNPRHQPGVDAGHDARRYHFAAQGRSSTPYMFEQLLRPRPVSERPHWDWLQASGAVVAQQLAAGDPAWAKKLLGKQRELRGAASAYDRRKQAVESVLGDDWLKIETRFAKLRKTIQPVWYVTAPLWQIGPQRSVLAGTSNARAGVIAQQPPPNGDYVVSGRAELGPGDARTGFALHLGSGADTFVGVDIDPKLVSVSEWLPATKTWEKRAEGQVELTDGQPFAFRIEVTRGEVRVLVDELLLVSWSHGGRETHLQWGLFARDRLVRFENLQCEPLAAPKK